MDQAERLRDLVKEKLNISKTPPKHNVDIYSIASGKGGVGKTNIVINLAIALQQRGKKVLIIDADLGLANVDVILGLLPKYTLYDVLVRGRPLEEAILTGPHGIKILPGGSGVMELANLDMDQHKSLAEDFLAFKDIDIILIDTGAGISKNLLSFITFSHELIMVTNPEPTAITDAYSVIKVLAQFKLERNIKLIVNRSSSQESATATFEKLNKTSDNFLQVKLEDFGYILDDTKVAQAVMAQEPFYLLYPNSNASKCIDQLADKLIGAREKSRRLTSIKDVYKRLLKVFG